MNLVSRFGAMQDERKMYNFMGDYYIEKFIDQFSARTSVSKEDLRFLLPDELESIFDKYDSKKVKARRKCFVLDCDWGRLREIYGENAIHIARNLGEVKKIEQSVIHGIVASIGTQPYFRGTAKIVHTVHELCKINSGDILVTTMTSPDFVIGMKKAGAIVTDTGGMLSHAAIVSRELKKPCIVGTEVATKIIKDGDIIELHCARGTIRIIKHK